MLYEAIAGATPFESSNYNALLRMIVEDEAATLRQRAGVDEILSDIVALGLRKNPDERFISLGAMGKALAAWLMEQGIAEDACGVSLESKWLSRQTDPHGRSSHPSMPDGWVEHMSGIRTIGRAFGTAPTVAASKAAGTPVALTRESTKAPERRWLWAGALLVALAGIAGLVSLSRHASDEPAAAALPSAAPASTVTAEIVRPRSPTLELPPATPTSAALAPAEPALPTLPAPPAIPAENAGPSAKPSSRELAPGKPKATDSSTADDKSKRAVVEPTTDLLAPY
jgi:hypothetical protein